LSSDKPKELSPEPFWITVVVAVLRFAPGAILGAALGFRMAVGWEIEDPLYFFAVVLLPATLVGFVSGKLGLAFWEGIRDYVRPFWRWF
jgi:hypothetical protein